MAGTAEPRIHHWIPQCYLKGFTSNGQTDGQLYVVDAKQRKAFTTRPRNVAAERDFNRIDVPGLDPNQVEGDMARFESDLALALGRLNQHGQFHSLEDLHLILQLVAILATRSPERREHVRCGGNQSSICLNRPVARHEAYPLVRIVGLDNVDIPLHALAVIRISKPGSGRVHG